MTENNLSFVQKIFKWMVPAGLFEKAKAESQKWFFVCDCGSESTIWEAGGIRYKAKGKPSVYVQCNTCCKKGLRKLKYKN